MEFGEMKRNTSNWSNFGMLLRRAGLTASAGLSCLFSVCARDSLNLHTVHIYYHLKSLSSKKMTIKCSANI